MSSRKVLPSRFRPPRETQFIQRLRNLMDESDGVMGPQLMGRLAKVRQHLAVATDEDLNDVVRLSVQSTPEKYTGTFAEILNEFRIRRQSCRNDAYFI